MTIGATAPASAAGFKVLYRFCSRANCADGQGPTTGLVSDSSGHLYGTTVGGGAYGHGVIYELLPNTDGSYDYKRLYSFCPQTNCTDGWNPGGLIVDSAGDLYGTTINGGSAHQGAIFQLTRKSGGWRYKTLYSFCIDSACSDGSEPGLVGDRLTYPDAASRLTYDSKSPLYGTTYAGGAQGFGVVYRLSPVQRNGKKRWKQKVLYSFCAKPNCADGAQPGGLILDKSGNLYGTAGGGIEGGQGVVFELAQTGSIWSETVLHTFCQSYDPSTNFCADGADPNVTLARDLYGNLYGTTVYGGAGVEGANAGTVFKIVPNGTNSTFSILYSFCKSAPCYDGQNPEVGVLIDDTGTVISGTASASGFGNRGELFELNGDSPTYLHDFCAKSCSDGSSPGSMLIYDDYGNLLGTTNGGGIDNGGTVFRAVP